MDWGKVRFLVCVILAVLVGTLLLTCGTLGCTAGLNYPICQETGEVLGLDVQFRLFGGCFIEFEEGKWVPLSDYHYVQGVNP